jgi:CHAD domain-containing protein
MLADSFKSFLSNLVLLRTSNSPEVVHAARVCWRRFKSGMRLFLPVFHPHDLPPLEDLKPLLTSLSRLRDLDVARFQTLPGLSHACKTEFAVRDQDWNRLMLVFVQEDRRQRRLIRAVLLDPGIQNTLTEISQWLDDLKSRDELFASRKVARNELGAWAECRVRQLHKRLDDLSKRPETAKRQHQVRILAKQLRYNIDMLREVLPRKMTKKWYLRAADLQASIGKTRDILRAGTLAGEINVPSDIANRLQYITSNLASAQDHSFNRATSA